MGSRLTMAGAAKNFKASTNCSLPELARMTALNQAELLGIADQVGSLEAGKKANLVLLDADLTVAGTVLNGRIIPPGM